MGLELIRSQVRDRGSPYAGLGESWGMLFLEIGDPDIGGGNYPTGLQPTTAPGLEVGLCSSYSLSWELGLPLAAAAQGECGNMGPLQHLRGNLAQAF